MSTYRDVSGLTPKEAWWKFHKENRHVYDMFKKQVIRAIEKQEMLGKIISKKPIENRLLLSSKMIINWMRWEMQFSTKSKDSFKINDIVTPYYGRLFTLEHPQYEGVFNTRELRSDK